MPCRNDFSTKIQGYSPEEYAAMFGCDASYDHKGHEGNGALFYNFSSELQKRDADYLARFIKAIEYDIGIAKAYSKQEARHGNEDVDGLTQLLAYVKNLTPEV